MLFSFFHSWPFLRLFSWYFGFPKPKYQIQIDKDVMVPSHDGVRLATDVYRPQLEGKHPVLMLRTPYGKERRGQIFSTLAKLIASQGFVCILQDVRGKYKSEGEFIPYENEGKDGHASIEWAGKAPWSNGSVALCGGSYLGSCAWLAAVHQSPYLKTIIPIFTMQNAYACWIDRGVPYLNDMLFWTASFGGKKDSRVNRRALKKATNKLPVIDQDLFLTGKKIPSFRKFMAHPIRDEFWDNISVDHKIDEIKIPALLIGGWCDVFVQAAVIDYERMILNAKDSLRKESSLMIGPWPHDPFKKYKEMPFGKEGDFRRIWPSILEWCNKWLKNESLNVPAVRYFVLGRNEWRESSVWPPKECKEMRLYLDQKGLLLKSASLEEKSQSYIYDPADPTHSYGSHMVFARDLQGPREQSLITSRKDVLTFKTEPFENEVIIVGIVKVKLWVSSDCTDTDFHVKIADLTPEGKAYYIQWDFIRASCRFGRDNHELLEPGKKYLLEFEIRSTCYAFKPGHCIQLQISSADFPHHTKNLNTGNCSETTTEFKKAENHIYFGGDHASHLVISLI